MVKSIQGYKKNKANIIEIGCSFPSSLHRVDKVQNNKIYSMCNLLVLPPILQSIWKCITKQHLTEGK